ncbi:ANTAR domain-containing response regulator [Methylocucumis oryzae]|uniref:Response regulator receiver protein n=1 Tax=Methylocucumis oryzae TaxID=1632867 RepID=A0A0F3IJ50_9GAMM|nr:ANTAR domain-containing protein [Methylocucumis oryzae]KJV06766.1 response regulator receiver protein [Methylocucumis oryzae]
MQLNKLNLLLIEQKPLALLENELSRLKLKFQAFNDSVNLLALVKQAEPDLIMIHQESISDKLIADLAKLNQHSPLPVVVFTQDDKLDTIQQLIKADVAELNLSPTNLATLTSTLQIALARFKQQQQLKTALDDVRVQLEDRKQIDRAKAILIKTRNFTEDEAYHTLRKLAMDRNITLGEMARNVIAMAELLK